jgi:PKD repeat protein
MTVRNSIARRLLGAVTASALITAALVGGFTAPALADTVPIDAPNNPATVSADPLPTTQIDGVAWAQVVVGNTVYVAGKFSNARPAGSAAGVNTTVRNNLLAYDITTGNLVTGFAPNLNGQARSIAASPDGTKLYVGGEFTQANGQLRSRIAAYNIPSGTLDPNFRPLAQTTVRAIVATNSTVYFGGDFTSVTSPQTGVATARGYIAAADAATGNLLPFNPNADAAVNAITLNFDKSKLVFGGRFQHVGGATQLGLSAADPATGAVVPWAANGVVQNFGTQAAINSLTSDADGVYGSGYVFGANGNLEGAFRADNNSGTITWIEDCHGDTYSVFPTADSVYVAGHPHYCGNVGGFPQTSPNWTFYNSIAFSKTVAGTITNDPYGYYNWAGTPRPQLLYWFPKWTAGSASGQGQATWSVSGSADGNYIVYAGEFPTVNTTAQQGLVRFGKKNVAGVTNKVAPVSSAALNPTAISQTAGTARIAFKTTWDRDNQHLTYKVYRNYTVVTGPTVCTIENSDVFWEVKSLGCYDTGLTPGTAYRYRVIAFDDYGNRATGTEATVTISNAAPGSSPYSDAVKADAPGSYYRLDEGTGTAAVYDSIGFNDMVAGSGVTRGATGALLNESDTASNFDGTENGLAATQSPIAGPDTFTTEAWIKTTTTNGGKIIGFGGNSAGDSGSYDRHVYMDNAGHIYFGVYTGNTQTLSSANTYNDGSWHLVTASMSSAGMRLSIDGKLVGSRADTTSGQVYNGYWRVGGDNIGGWPGQPNSKYFAGTIDEVAIYPTALSAQDVAAHYEASGRANPLPQPPADAYGAAVFNLEPDLYWRLGDNAGPIAEDSGAVENDGNIQGGVSLGTTGAIANTSNKAATFNGSDGVVVASAQANNPTVYTEMTWFKTTTTNGGKLMGFGNANSGLSGNYDRHIYMEGSGQLTFGVWTGFTNTATSPLAYNDGNWHLMVATQSNQGLKLYVDGAVVATNGQTEAQAYSGYWRIGGDNNWGGQPWFAGSLDDSAVFSKALTDAQVSQLYALGAGANATPTASFTSSVTKLDAAFDASNSADPDGTIDSYSWNFGDGSAAGSGKTPTHTYANAGTYTVTLTVTDNGGKTATTSNVVTTVSTPNADFTSHVTKLAVTFDGSTSSDVGATITGYAWDFGDGATDTQATTSHTYANGGTYVVKLTITDSSGNTDTEQANVVAVDNAAPTAVITSSTNKLKLTYDGTGSGDTDGTIAGYAWTFGDGATSTSPSGTHTYANSGSFTVTLTVTDNNGATDTASQVFTISQNVGPTAVFTSTKTGLTASFDGSGSTDSDGTVDSYSWDFGDSSALGTGATPSHAYALDGTYTVTLTVTDNDGGIGSVQHTVTVAAPPANVKPTAAFTSNATNLAVSFDGSGSTDSDGTISTYAWDFGDGGTATTAKPSHTYATANTYTVTLTVTDDGGLTDAATHTVTVTAPPPPSGNFAADLFGRTTATGFGTADTGGAWTVAGSASNYSVGGGTGNIRLATAGSGPSAYLNSVSSTDSDVTVDVSLDKVPNGGGGFVAVVGRGTSTNAYRGKVKIASNGVLTLYITKVVAGAETTVLTGTSTTTFAAGDTLHLRMQAVGSGTTALKFKAWKGSTEPSSWALSGTDTTAALQSASGVGIWAYSSGSTTNVPIVASFDNFAAKSSSATPPPVNVKPTAAFTSNPNDLVVAFNGSGSTDSDGNVVSYSWDFGDSTALGTGATPSHTYATAGTRVVTLTVTDNGGLTDTVTHSVTVTAPPPPAGNFAADLFGRTTATGFGTADTGGAWTVAGSAANYSVAGGTGNIRLATAGSAPSAYLNSVSSTDSDVTLDASLDKVPNGGGGFVAIVMRGTASNAYRGKVKIASNGVLTLYVTKVVAGAETTVLTGTSATTFAAGDTLHLRAQAVGSGTTALKFKVWKGGTEPSTWGVSTTDTTAALQSASGVGIWTYSSGSTTNQPIVVSVDNFSAKTTN